MWFLEVPLSHCCNLSPEPVNRLVYYLQYRLVSKYNYHKNYFQLSHCRKVKYRFLTHPRTWTNINIINYYYRKVGCKRKK